MRPASQPQFTWIECRRNAFREFVKKAVRRSQPRARSSRDFFRTLATPCRTLLRCRVVKKKKQAAAVAAANGLNSLEAFLGLAGEFRLGHLPTEQIHPRTRRLSQLAQDNPAAALRDFAAVDAAALRATAKHAPLITNLAEEIAATRAGRGRIFLVGCGATGRLVLNLEELWRRQATPDQRENVVAFMAGGDAALVRSFEGFEDHPEYGARHLRQLGFRKNDLLIAVTEGGETPYVIGAALAAAERSVRPVWFVFCNPAKILISTLARCREVLTHPRVRALELTVGPMALAGSTRLQATTVQMAAVGWALLHGGNEADCGRFLHGLASTVKTFPHVRQAALVCAEQRAYRGGGRVEYRASHRAITVLADTTERAPTFNLAPFENRGEFASGRAQVAGAQVAQVVGGAPAPRSGPSGVGASRAQLNPVRSGPRLSWCYVTVAGARDAAAAWRQLLGDRTPRPLAWATPLRFRRQLTMGWMNGFDLSERGKVQRASGAEFLVSLRADRRVQLSVGQVAVVLPIAATALEETLLLKLALNAHSTVLMGRMGRYAGNVMTWVRPTNLKLIDRATRYVQALTRGKTSYRSAAAAVFAEMPALASDQSIVLAAVGRLKS